MNQGIFAPWVIYGALALGIVLTCLMFVVLELQIYHLRRARGADQQRTSKLEAGLEEARQVLAKLRDNVHEIDQQRGTLVPPQPARSGLNLGNRTQALRMFRAGQDCAAIAAALQLPRAEVELLIRVQGVHLRQVAHSSV